MGKRKGGRDTRRKGAETSGCPAPTGSGSQSPATQAQGSEEQSVQQVASAIAGLSMNELVSTAGGRFGTGLALKKPAGGLGTTVPLRTNFFRLTLRKDASLVHYEVTFKAEKTRAKVATGGKKGRKAGGDAPDVGTTDLKTRKLVNEVFQHMIDQFSGPNQDFHKRRLVFDGRNNMYSVNQRLEKDANVLRFRCMVDGEERAIIAEYKLADQSSGGQVLDLADKSQASVQGLDIALGYPIGLEKVQRTFRFFDPKGESIGMNLILLQGFKKSVRACSGGYYVNVDRAAGLFQAGGRLTQVFGNIINFTKRPKDAAFVVRTFRMDDTLQSMLEKELMNLKVKAEIKGTTFKRTYRITGFSVKPIDQLSFHWSEKDKEVTVAQYYKEQYGMVLAPNLPAVISGRGEKKNYIPIEVCNLMDNQYHDKKMHAKIQQEVTKATIKDPPIRYNAINRSVTEMKNLVNGTIDCLIASQGQVVDGRVLPPPDIQSGSGVLKLQDPTKRQANDRTKPCDFSVNRFSVTKTIERWSIVQLTRGPPAREVHPFLKTFGSKLSLTANRKGWRLSPNFQTKTLQYRGRQAMAEFMTAAKQKEKIQLLLFAMPVVDDMYNDIKSCSNEIGIVAQCLNFDVTNQDDMNFGDRRSQVSKMGGMFVDNMLKKMNAKVGGTKSSVAQVSVPDFLKDRNIMFVGMDVYHPPAYADDVQSLVGIVASYDKDFTQYFHQTMAQPQVDPDNKKRVEEIREAVYIILKDFFVRYKVKNGGHFPDHVIVLRDGVSEGQFLRVRDMEVHQIHRAIADSGFKANVTFLTVQKRHSFRMFVEYKDFTGQDSVKNPLPGTVVDTDVVHADRNEYYLNSYHALQGTSKPSHYCLIHDEADLSNDQIQGMSYVLSYLSARCDKPISVPVPVNYAHLVAERASKLLESGQRERKKKEKEAGKAGDKKQKETKRVTGDEDLVREQQWINSVIKIHENKIDKLDYV